ncbi:hypothetical protein IAD21_05132 [Abditibacteriota bacterium]|nr:hypothetical protein IAD21_05132 [Abditibacteriota bacterium]
MKINLLRPCVLGVTICLGTAALAPLAGAAPKSKMRASRLEIWPGQRVLVVLPLQVSDSFMSGDASASSMPSEPPTAGTAPDTTPMVPTMSTGNGGALASALVPLLSPQLSDALKATGKFSVMRPYKFDPLLSRAVAEQSVQADAASAFIQDPSLGSSQAVLPLLRLDQPGMVAQVVIQSLRVGGTQAAPTVQLSVRGDLYQADSAQPFRTITVTSRPFTGATPEDRLRAAAGQAFSDIAAAFVAPPTEFELPLPAMSGMMTGATPGGSSAPAMGDLPMQPSGTATTPAMPMPMPANPVAPQMPNGTMGTPLAPQLPSATPPLGVNVPGEN